MRKALISLAFLAFLTSFGQSVPEVNIQSIKNDNRLEIKLSPDGEFDQVLSSLVFTLKWNNSYEIGDLDLSYSSYNVFKSGDQITNGEYTYQVYVGFGMSQMSENGMSLDPTCPLGSFIINPKGDYVIINDGITDLINGNYYVSLNGEDMTGEITNKIEEVKENTTSSIYPNPFGNFLTIKTNEYPKGIQIIDLSGKVIYESYSVNIFQLNVESVPSGNYLIRIIFKDRVEILKGIKI